MHPLLFTSTRTILLIEDQATDSLLIRQLLSTATAPGRARYQVDWEKTVEDGLAYLQSNTPYAVLLDLHLPGTEGLETFQQFSHYADEVPIVALTGLDDQELAFELLNSGAQDYLLKDHVTRWSLVHAVEFAKNRHRIHQQLMSFLEAHSESGRAFRSLVDSMPVGLVVCEANGTVLFANRQGCRDAAAPLQELVGQRWALEASPESGGTITISPAGRGTLTVSVSEVLWEGRECVLLTTHPGGDGMAAAA